MDERGLCEGSLFHFVLFFFLFFFFSFYQFLPLSSILSFVPLFLLFCLLPILFRSVSFFLLFSFSIDCKGGGGGGGGTIRTIAIYGDRTRDSSNEWMMCSSDFSFFRSSKS